jgi:hypothetical protein
MTDSGIVSAASAYTTAWCAVSMAVGSLSVSRSAASKANVLRPKFRAIGVHNPLYTTNTRWTGLFSFGARGGSGLTINHARSYRLSSAGLDLYACRQTWYRDMVYDLPCSVGLCVFCRLIRIRYGLWTSFGCICFARCKEEELTSYNGWLQGFVYNPHPLYWIAIIREQEVGPDLPCSTSVLTVQIAAFRTLSLTPDALLLDFLHRHDSWKYCPRITQP